MLKARSSAHSNPSKDSNFIIYHRPAPKGVGLFVLKI
uniref:Uncharacterized protein n=1 Tax=Siphoviridae sp. ctgN495 TaxID=2825608 RepID=A0A8S5UCR7_9CAUD|nr:MAG TPA: hypothetical protein [Siphoviridae sp. ctgN495]